MDKNKVTYGLSNVHIWPITATSADGVPTYGSVIAIIGSILIMLVVTLSCLLVGWLCLTVR